MKPFRFKQFTINQDSAAMKVGTDGVLLGSWAGLEANPESILDIGSGTGLVALMLAQRSAAATIDAIEVDPAAFEQCVENFEASSWADRLYCYHAGLGEFVDESDDRYDLILSNPPFYSEEVSSGNRSRDTARQQKSLPLDVLLSGVAQLLSPQGRFCVILPFRAEPEFLETAGALHLFPNRITRVRGNPESAVKRTLLEMSFKTGKTTYEELTIELARHQYTEAYIGLTRDFYLKM